MSGQRKTPPPTTQRGVSSTMEGASALAKTIATQLATGQYECMICTERIRHSTATWSCDTCFRVFHLSCAKKWADSDGSGEGSAFRCPGCQHQYPSRPRKYYCFCKKRVDPHNDGFSVPHSCGDVCGKKRKNCPHPCAQPCHPGPCSDCNVRAPAKTCPCGRTTYDYPCGKDDPKTTCGSICGKMLACGEHTCELQCHHGPCPPCQEESTIPCRCGKNTKSMPCGSDAWQCDLPCDELQRCGNCKCNVVCHKGPCPPCDTDVQLITHCPCGAKAIPSTARKSCKDPIPTCGGVCGKVLLCGSHYCEEPCHNGPCKPCSSKITIKCPCNSSTRKVQCMEASMYRCSQKCKTKLTCGRHECESLCCSHKGNPGHPVHVCRKTCNKQLPCGHPCGENCHRGACPPCHQIVTTELACNCGLEILYPPQPCGTEPPVCHRPCEIPQPCGHPAVPHNCHFGPCPPCMKTVSRMCMGGHMEVSSVVCSVGQVSCGNQCAKQLPCGHFCQKKCHAGPCIQESSSTDPRQAKKNGCQQICGTVLPCGHACAHKCHHGTECPKCNTKVEITCECGASTRKLPCADYQVKLAAVRRGSPKAEGDELNASEAVEMHAKVTFPCTDDCAYQRRLSAIAGLGGTGSNDRFAGLGGSGGGSGTSGRRTFYSLRTWSLAKADVDGVISVEKQLTSFLSSNNQTLMMPTMPKDKRIIVHELCWYYHIACEAVDREPQRSCYLTKTPNTTTPNPPLSKAVYDDYENPNTIAAKILKSNTEATKKSIVMEGDGLNEVAIHGLMKQFAGQMIIVPHEEKESTFFLVFPWGGDMGTAYAYLRRSGHPSIHFYRYGDDPFGVGSGGSAPVGGRVTTSTPTAGGASSVTTKAAPKKAAGKSWATLAREPKKKDGGHKDPFDVRNAFGALRK